MLRRRTVLALLAALAVAAVAVAQTPQNPGGEPTDFFGTACYDCHYVQIHGREGRMETTHDILPAEDVRFNPGEPVEYTVTVGNPWAALMYDIVAVVDITDAPSLGFSPGRGAVNVELPGTLASPTDTGERTVRETVRVPSGASDLRIRVVPDDPPPFLEPDLVLRLWPPGADTDSPAPIEVDEGGSGDAEVFQVRGNEAIAELGAGDWTVEAAQSVLGDLPASLVEQPLRFTMDAWFNVTGETMQVQASPDRLDGQARDGARTTQLSWFLVAVDPPGEDEALRVTVDVTLHYLHPGTTSQWRDGVRYDTWRYTKTLEVMLLGEDGGVVPQPPGAPRNGPVPPPPPPELIPWTRVGEIIGYIATFLLVFSVVTGGVFGRGSRRALNRVFRSARRRVAFHNFVSYALTFVAVVHTVLFLIEPRFHWALGLLWGGIALLCLFLLGVTGALQVPMIRRWNFAVWRWTHLLLAIGAVVFTVVHILLDGFNFATFQDTIGWQDPLVPRQESV